MSPLLLLTGYADYNIEKKHLNDGRQHYLEDSAQVWRLETSSLPFLQVTEPIGSFEPQFFPSVVLG